MKELIEKEAVINMINEMREEGYCDAREIRDRIMFMMQTVPDINRAEILRLCNEIEDIVSEISKLSENYLIYSDCKSIMNRTKAIGKELAGDAEKID